MQAYYTNGTTVDAGRIHGADSEILSIVDAWKYCLGGLHVTLRLITNSHAYMQVLEFHLF